MRGLFESGVGPCDQHHLSPVSFGRRSPTPMRCGRAVRGQYAFSQQLLSSCVVWLLLSTIDHAFALILMFARVSGQCVRMCMHVCLCLPMPVIQMCSCLYIHVCMFLHPLPERAVGLSSLLANQVTMLSACARVPPAHACHHVVSVAQFLSGLAATACHSLADLSQKPAPSTIVGQTFCSQHIDWILRG
jgi:hypothetical protein